MTREDYVKLVDYLAGLGGAVNGTVWGLGAALLIIEPKAGVVFFVVDWIATAIGYTFIKGKLRRHGMLD